MSKLFNFVEIQSGIEFLYAIFYFLFSIYMFFLLYLKRTIAGKEKNLLQATSYGFLAISVTFFIKLMVQNPNPEFGYLQSNLCRVLFMMLLTLPAQFYCTNKVNSVKYCLKHYSFSLLILLAINIIAQFISIKYLKINQEISNAYLYISLILYFLFSGYLGYKFWLKIYDLSKEKWQTFVNHKNDIFIFLAFTIFSIMLLIFIYIDVRYYYIRGVFSMFTIINTFLFLKITYPYNSGTLITDVLINDTQESPQSERHKFNRQLSDNLKADELYDRLLIYFEKEKPYLKADLKIKEVALYLYSNKTYLSRIVNDKNNQNFNQFVNYYRIEEAKKLFNTNTKLNIQELCYLSGFGSMATFSIAFRYYLGYTPADWCKEQKLKIQND